MLSSSADRQARLQAMPASRRPALYDGAKGVFLSPRLADVGKPPSDLTEWLNLLAPETVRRAHRDYVEAGSDIIQTNSFSGNRFQLEHRGLASRTREVNLLAAQIARDAAGDDVLVAGDLGPSGKLLAMGEVAREALVEAFAQQAKGLEEGGVDFFHVETMSDLEEAVAAVEGIRSVSSLPVALTMSFDSGKVDAGFRTMMGVSARQLGEKARELGLFGVGANCGRGLEGYQTVIRQLVEAAGQARSTSSGQAVVIAKLNTGVPQMQDGEVHYGGSPEEMAGYALWCTREGVGIIGGCCGSTPAHIEAMAQALAREGLR
jgi:5-methyltetrahydrofolate--homocysteine methyltransferase